MSFWSSSDTKLFYSVGLLLFCFVSNVSGSIHEYRNEVFTRQSNAFFFHGGSEGLYASKQVDSPDSDNKSLKGKSFIR